MSNVTPLPTPHPLVKRHGTSPERMREMVRELALWMYDQGVENVNIARTPGTAKVQLTIQAPRPVVDPFAQFTQVQPASEPGFDEGETCGRNGCDGTIELREVENCTCHISPPCGACTAPRGRCDTCDWEDTHHA